jgi:hypothetical protein
VSDGHLLRIALLTLDDSAELRAFEEGNREFFAGSAEP